MQLTTVVNIRKEAYDVLVARPSRFGNPFREGADGDRHEVIEKYKTWFLDGVKHNHLFRYAAQQLRGKRLGCYCVLKPCHAHVIAAWCNGEL